MNKILFFFTLLVLMISKLSAQEIINDATLDYAVSVLSSKDPNANKIFEGATYKVYLKGNASRSELKTALGMESTIYDGKEKKGVILKEYSNQKLMIMMSESNWLSRNNNSHGLNFKEEIGTYNINGFQCNKTTAWTSNNEQVTVYFCPTIVLNNKDYNNNFSEITGLPVKYERKLPDGSNYVYLLVNVNYDIVSSNKFEFPKSGYRIMSYDDVMKVDKERNK